MNQRSFVKHRRFSNLKTLLKQLPGVNRASICIVVDRRQRLASRNRVSDFLVQYNSHGGIDGIFFPFASPTEDNARRADLLALHAKS